MNQRAAPSLFIASLGNPGSRYAQTLHSAGHYLLAVLVSCAEAPVLSTSRLYEKAEVSETTDNDGRRRILFWRSPSYMNTSGSALAKSFTKFSETSSGLAETNNTTERQKFQEEQLSKSKLVILHDELELPIGKFKISSGAGKSARGHNGLKSVLAQSSLKNLDFIRVGIGIGPRPQSRDPDVVASYVLRRFKPAEEEKLGSLAPHIWQRLL